MDNEIDIAFEKEQRLMKERGRPVLALIPMDLDGFLPNGWTSGKGAQVRKRLAADFKEWETSHSKFEEQIQMVIQALRADEHLREKPPQPRL